MGVNSFFVLYHQFLEKNFWSKNWRWPFWNRIKNGFLRAFFQKSAVCRCPKQKPLQFSAHCRCPNTFSSKGFSCEKSALKSLSLDNLGEICWNLKLIICFNLGEHWASRRLPALLTLETPRMGPANPGLTYLAIPLHFGHHLHYHRSHDCQPCWNW